MEVVRVSPGPNRVKFEDLEIGDAFIDVDYSGNPCSILYQKIEECEQGGGERNCVSVFNGRLDRNAPDDSVIPQPQAKTTY